MTHVRPKIFSLPRSSTLSLLILAVLGWGACLAPCAVGQARVTTIDPQPPLPSGTPKSWAEAAVRHELAILQDEDQPMRYCLRVVNRKGDTTREIIETAQGNVARLVQRDGKPITAAEDAAERSRLDGILTSPGDFLKHERRNGPGKTYALQIIKLMPSATLYAYTPGQPQPSGAVAPQVVIDFRPDPAFHPPSMVTELLTGLQGRVWIDARTGTMTRIQADIVRPVNFGWGFVARVYPGGRIELEQTLVDGKRWTLSHLDSKVTVRELMLHTVNDKTKMSAWNFQLLPAPISFRDAVHALLAEKIPLQ